MRRVILAMSGGVDSTVAAWLLREQGWDVTAVTFDFWRDGASSEAMTDAADVCRDFGIPHSVVDCRKDFLNAIVSPFRDEYLSGRTPNPCVRCNPAMKFAALGRLAEEQGVEAVATGHYAHVGRLSAWRQRSPDVAPPKGIQTWEDDRFALWRADDASKDQSYVLYGLDQSQLARCVFPLAGMMKEEVRALAAKQGLHTHNRPDSQEICFLPGNDYGAFIERSAPERTRPGPIVDMTGREVGRHEGIHHFTIGQRKGLGVAFGAPRYVVRIEPETSTVVIGNRDDTLTTAFGVSLSLIHI